MERIKNLDEDERDCVWLFCKLKLQLDSKRSMKDSKTSSNDSQPIKLTVDRVNSNDLSVEQFKVSWILYIMQQNENYY